LVLILVMGAALGLSSYSQNSFAAAKTPGGVSPHEDWVPDEETAIRIAEAVSRAQVGDKELAKIKPFKAELNGDTWMLKSRIGLGGDANGNNGIRGIAITIHRNTGEILELLYYPLD